MKSILFLFLFLNSGLNVFAQLYTFIEEGVKLESTQTIRLAKQLAEAVKQLNATKDLINTQKKAIESLKEGGWDGFMGALDYQIETYYQFRDQLDDLEALEKKMIGLPEDASTQKRKAIQKQIREANKKLLNQTTSFLKNTKRNFEQQKNIYAMAQGKGSITTQMELNTQTLLMVSSSLMDLQNILVASQKVSETRQSLEEEEQKIKEQENKAYFLPQDDSMFDPTYPKEEFTGIVLGKNRLNQGLKGLW